MTLSVTLGLRQAGPPLGRASETAGVRPAGGRRVPECWLRATPPHFVLPNHSARFKACGKVLLSSTPSAQTRQGSAADVLLPQEGSMEPRGPPVNVLGASRSGICADSVPPHSGADPRWMLSGQTVASAELSAGLGGLQRALLSRLGPQSTVWGLGLNLSPHFPPHTKPQSHGFSPFSLRPPSGSEKLCPKRALALSNIKRGLFSEIQRPSAHPWGLPSQ